MINVRKASERGRTHIDWLDSYHSFSFGDYHDQHHMGFRTLRVINDDRVAPGSGFATHGHRDMEIVTYVLDGALEHRDSRGNGSVIRPGEIQRMSAGSGIQHSEYNPSPRDPVHLLQIWLQPAALGLAPGYEQRAFDRERAAGRFLMLAGPPGAGASVTIHQDARLWVTSLDAGASARFEPADGRYAWIQIARGDAGLNGHALGEGDGAGISEERELTFEAKSRAEILLFDLA